LKLNVSKARAKIAKLIDGLSGSDEFQEIHEETLNLCEIFYSRKSDYLKIDKDYPERIEIVVKFFGGDGEDSGEDKVIECGNREEELSKLRSDSIDVLKKLDRRLGLREELEVS